MEAFSRITRDNYPGDYFRADYIKSAADDVRSAMAKLQDQLAVTGSAREEENATASMSNEQRVGVQ